MFKSLPLFGDNIPTVQNYQPTHLKEVGLANFKQEVMQSLRPVIVDFWGEGCGPCRMLGPVLERYAVDHATQVKVVKVNISKEVELAQYFQIAAVPTLIIFKGGKALGKIVGLARPEQLNQLLAIAA